MRHRTILGCLAALGFLSALPGSSLAEKLTPAETALRVDESLAAEMLAAGVSPGGAAPGVDHETFLRRVTLDLVGELPTPEQVTAFVLDPDADKRARLVDRLLADVRYGQNWGRYWRDVILFRRSDDRALIAGPALEAYLTDELNRGAGWDEVARSFVTATGDVREVGSAGLIMAQMGETAETTSEIARIFLGIQIQCAQCHDHPTDRWKRQQFHELAAFFPRVEIRPVRDGERRSFAVVGVDNPRGRRRPNNQMRATPEHFMPDLEDPSAEGTLMKPRFFVTGRTIEVGKTDQERRTLLANWMTADSDPWFDRAYVNRMWAELVGEGFYEPVDDLGPDRQCSAPATLDILATQFRANHHDARWLFRTITSTEVYQRQSRSRRLPDEAPFGANCAQRMRADQLFNALTTALGIENVMQGGRNRGQGGAYRGLGGPRAIFSFAFGYDPSEPREEVVGSIPQALVMMNSPVLNREIDSRRPNTALARLLAAEPDDESVVVELYLRCLARQPQPAELETCLDHVRETGDRGEAFEDVLWALINSTEFLHRK
jgi:hypothetical protein